MRQAVGMCLVLKPCVFCVVSLQHVSMFDYVGDARAWTRQATLYMPCGEAVCAVCREFVTDVHASLTFAKSQSIYTLYTCATKGHKTALIRKPNATPLIIIYIDKHSHNT